MPDRTPTDYNERAVKLAACSWCGAERGQQCLGASGRRIKNTHFPRRQDANKIAKGAAS